MSHENPPTDPGDRDAADSSTGSRTDPSTDVRDRDRDRDHEGAHADSDESDRRRDSGGGGLSDRAAFWISMVFGFALAIAAVALVSGRAPFFEDVLRVRPTVEGGGVGADWLVGNTGPILEWLIVLVHFADVVMGIFILVMVFVHWAAFRQLAVRMQPPEAATRDRGTTTATDGGGTTASSSETEHNGGDSP